MSNSIQKLKELKNAQLVYDAFAQHMGESHLTGSETVTMKLYAHFLVRESENYLNEEFRGWLFINEASVRAFAEWLDDENYGKALL